MSVDFHDAADRHWEDANVLLSQGTTANADHLFGLSAECGLKAIMEATGMLVSKGKPPKAYQVHIDELWDEFDSFAAGRRAARYRQQIAVAGSPFQDWNVGQRYFHRSAISSRQAKAHKAAARIVREALEDAILDGVLT